jgi:hypothetical protein
VLPALVAPSPPSSASSSHLDVDDADLEVLESPPRSMQQPQSQPQPQHSPRTSKHSTSSSKRASGSGGTRREQCGLCDEWWVREQRDGSASYPDAEGTLLPKCPKCNKVQQHPPTTATITIMHPPQGEPTSFGPTPRSFGVFGCPSSSSGRASLLVTRCPCC